MESVRLNSFYSVDPRDHFVEKKREGEGTLGGNIGLEVLQVRAVERNTKSPSSLGERVSNQHDVASTLSLEATKKAFLCESNRRWLNASG